MRFENELRALYNHDINSKPNEQEIAVAIREQEAKIMGNEERDCQELQSFCISVMCL